MNQKLEQCVNKNKAKPYDKGLFYCLHPDICKHKLLLTDKNDLPANYCSLSPDCMRKPAIAPPEWLGDLKNYLLIHKRNNP